MLVRSIIAALVLATSAVPAVAKESLEARVERMEAESDIRRVLIEYGKYLDTRDYAGYVSLFAEDGVWTGGFGSFTGRPAIQKMLVDGIGTPPAGFINKSNYHMMTNPLIEIDGNRAKVESKFLFWTASVDGLPNPSHAGRYVDEFVKVGGEWKIARRTAWGELPYADPTAGPAAPVPARSEAVLLQRLADEEAIRGVLLEYGRSFDERRLQDYANLFAENGTWGSGDNPVRGPAGVLKMITDTTAMIPTAPGARNFHVMTNMVVDVADDGKTATAWSRYTFYMPAGDGTKPEAFVSGVYDDTLAKIDGTWKFMSRKLTADVAGRPPAGPPPSK
jgi:3-phenylpropionate/cinnamic acid dioxygenase small subunit